LGGLVQLVAECSVPVALYWHQWKLGPEGVPPTARVALLDQVGAALQAGAKTALEQTTARKPRTRRAPGHTT
jgi:LysR family transcriptional regulator, chromosome initiation inhibitor